MRLSEAAAAGVGLSVGMDGIANTERRSHPECSSINDGKIEKGIIPIFSLHLSRLTACHHSPTATFISVPKTASLCRQICLIELQNSTQQQRLALEIVVAQLGRQRGLQIVVLPVLIINNVDTTTTTTTTAASLPILLLLNTTVDRS